MEMIMTNIFNLCLVEIEITKRRNFIALWFSRDIPKCECAIITTSNNLPMFIRIPLKRISFRIMSRQFYFGIYFNSTRFEHNFIKNMNFSKRCSCCNKISFFRMVLYHIDLSIMLDLMLHYYHLFHMTIVLLYRFISFYCFFVEK